MRDNKRSVDHGGTGRRIEPFILLWLAHKPDYGYNLARMAAAVGFRRPAEDPSVLYKVLCVMEKRGFLASTWSTDKGGPRRRIYKLTPSGEAYLHERAADLARQEQRLAVFAESYGQRFPERVSTVDTGDATS
ncbi:PadR family transcriptional regulator [Chloroflexota bacterium]